MAIEQAMEDCTMVDWVSVIGPGGKPVRIARLGVPFKAALSLNLSDTAQVANAQTNLEIYEIMLNKDDVQNLGFELNDIFRVNRTGKYILVTNNGIPTPQTSVMPLAMFTGKTTNDPFAMV